METEKAIILLLISFLIPAMTFAIGYYNTVKYLKLKKQIKMKNLKFKIIIAIAAIVYVSSIAINIIEFYN